MLTSGDLTPKICFKISPQQEFTFYGRDGQVVGTMNFSRTPAFEGSLDESAHLFFNGVANLWNNEILALRAKLQAAEAEVGTLKQSCESWNELVQDLQAEVARLRNAALYTMGRLQLDIDSGDRPDQWSMQDIVNQHRAALEVGK